MAKTFEVLGFLHVNVEVTDVERALRFYRIFGLKSLDRKGTPGRAGAWLSLPDGSELHISLGPAKPPSRVHFAIRVENLAAARAVVEASNALIESERDIPGQIRFFTRDPDGNRIEIVEYLEANA
jgi:catechol 2,3-dioxygenase-like lactoylglutathione lyase family enzyme